MCRTASRRRASTRLQVLPQELHESLQRHRHLSPASHLFTGYLVAEAGEIKLLRETFNPLAMAQAQLPNGIADIEPPGDEVHSF